jgi:hypothetical protein
MSAVHSGAQDAFAARAAIRPALAVLALASLLIGCSVHPLPDDVTRKSTYDIVDKIRCEAKAAVDQFATELRDASIVYTFTFDIDESNDANLGLTFLNPLVSGPLTVNTGLQSNQLRNGYRNFVLLDSFDDLRKMNCTRDREKNWIYPLTGDVGMYDSVATFIRVQQGPGGARVFSLADTLTYTTTFQAGVTSSVALAPLNDQFRLTGASAGLTGMRTDVHKLTVTMAAGQQVAPAAHGNPRERFAGGRFFTRQIVPRIDAGIARFGDRNVARRNLRNGDPGSSGVRDGGGVAGVGGPEGLGVAGGFNSLLSTRMLQQESGAENRALYEQDRQRQLELQRRSTDIRVLVGP